MSFIHLQDPVSTKASMSVIFAPTTYAVVIIFDPLSAYLQKRIDPRILVLGGVVCMATALFLAPFSQDYVQFLMLYGFLANSGATLLTIVALLCSWEWFPDVRGQVTGIVLAFQAMSRGVIAFAGLFILNPHSLPLENPSGDGVNFFYPESVGERVPLYCTLVASYISVVGLTGAFFIKRNEDIVQKDV